ncbi:polysaccharide biosynthesis tyrosine autokinase [uncultured Nitrosomonas sp.]|uniref:polysaccharide biosynthesis tyrosine autokinase n=1 Tax=uncultured Nitrosomonas sp. TaxID=156424 RepID=UPI0025FA69E0|nr:polysaccharide biosynthesis tyrosine autokinase [uncultured Nitrosomonas sp.]
MIGFQKENTRAADNYQPNQKENEDDLNLVELLAILAYGKWLIILVTLAVTFLGVAKAYLDKPVYRADAMLQLDEKSRALTGIEPIANIFVSNLPVIAEIELIKSRMVLGKAIINMKLDIEAKPKRFPVVGDMIASRFQRRNEDNTVSDPIAGLSRYAWGGEVIQVDTFTVPADLRDKEFTLLAGEQGHFQIIYDDEPILEGNVGKLASKQIKNNQQLITIFVSLLKSRPGTQFTIKRLSENSAIAKLKDNLVVSEKNAQKNKHTGIIELALESHSPDQAMRVLNEIARIYIQQNVEHKSSETQQTLEFLYKQLPSIKKQLEISTTALNNYRNRKGSVDLDMETGHILNNLVNIKTKITLLQQSRDELRQRFTESHPSVIAVDKQISRLKEQMNAHENMVKKLPETQQVIVGLSGDVEVNKNLYNTLLNNAQTLKVAKAGTVGDARIIDYAILPEVAIKPVKILIISFAFVFGMFLGIVAVFVRRMLQRGIEDPDLIEKQLGIPVYATVSYSKNQGILNKEASKRYKSDKIDPILLAKIYQEDNAIESLRSFRTTLHFSLLDAKNNIVLISGPSPNVGKSFISLNLAAVMADSGKKVLLIDADLRKGTINKSLGVSRKNGLSEIISNTVMVNEAIHKIPLANIDFIPTGALPPNPSELLLHERFGVFLKTLIERYDLVIIDSPPILAATDAAIIGRFANATFMVIKAGLHTKRELEQSIKRFNQSGTKIKGIVFNSMPEISSRYGHSYSRYVYQYSYKK